MLPDFDTLYHPLPTTDKEKRQEASNFFKPYLVTIRIPNTAPTRAPIHGLDVMAQTLPLHLPKYPITPPIMAPANAPRIYFPTDFHLLPFQMLLILHYCNNFQSR